MCRGTTHWAGPALAKALRWLATRHGRKARGGADEHPSAATVLLPAAAWLAAVRLPLPLKPRRRHIARVILG